MVRRSLAESAGHFWQPAEFENVANPDFEHTKHLQNPGHLSLTTPSMYQGVTRGCQTIGNFQLSFCYNHVKFLSDIFQEAPFVCRSTVMNNFNVIRC